MKNAMKKVLSAVLALVLVVGMCPAAFATETDPAETEALATEAPVATEAPAETEAPETVAPETEAPETEAPETEAPETVPTETVAPTQPEETEPKVEYVTFWYGPDNSSVKVEIKNGKVTTPAEKFVNGYTFCGWMIDGKLVDAGVEIEVSGAASISAYYEDTNPTATYTLNVYARKYVDDVLKETQLIHTNKNMQQNDKVLEYLNTVKADLRSEVEKRFPTCSWSGNFYNYYGDQVATDNVLTTNGEKNVYINCYSTEAADVMIYIYRSSTKTCSRIIEIDGYEAGEVVTATAVKNAVKNYYSFNKFYMYDAEGWKDFKNDKEATNTNGVTVKGEGTTKIYVYLTGSSSTSSGTADSSNPKTGDTIFMAATVMALSASALALAYVFNKKRSVK